VKITVKYFGQLRQVAGVEGEDGECPAETTVQDYLKNVAKRHEATFSRILFDEQDRLRPSVIVAINDAVVGRGRPCILKDNDQVTLLAAIAGG
jgi:molybdopterin converting factor small subunit